MKKNNWIWVAVVLIIVIVSIYWYGSNTKLNNDENKEIKIGAILPLTGPGGVFANYIKKGIDLKVEEVNKENKNKILIIYEDSKNNPGTGITAYKKLKNIDKVNYIIPALSSVSKALMNFAGPESSLQMGTAVAFPNYSNKSDYIFRFYPNASSVSGVMADYFLNEMQIQKVGILYINDEFGKACADNFKTSINLASSSDKEVSFVESYELTQKDFKQTIEKLNSSSAEAIYVSGYGPAYTSFIKQLKELQKKDYIIMGDMTLGLPTTFQQLGNLMDGVYFVDGNMSKTFVDKYIAKYGEKPSTYAGYAYDLIGIFNESIKNIKEKNNIKESSRAIKLITDYKGCMGNITINSTNEIELKFVVHHVVDGKVEIINF